MTTIQAMAIGAVFGFAIGCMDMLREIRNKKMSSGNTRNVAHGWENADKLRK